MYHGMVTAGTRTATHGIYIHRTTAAAALQVTLVLIPADLNKFIEIFH